MSLAADRCPAAPANGNDKIPVVPFPFPPYLPPIGGPHYWQKETSGRLREAVTAYFDNRVYLNGTENRPISPADCELVADYIRHWIHAPMYDANPYLEADPEQKEELASLRAQADALTDANSIDRWIHKALESGIDPF